MVKYYKFKRKKLTIEFNFWSKIFKSYFDKKKNLEI